MGLIRQVILLCALLAASAKLSSSQDSGSGHQCYIGLAGQTPAPGTCTVATTQCAKLEKDGEAAYAKIEAARQLEIKVIMIERPVIADRLTFYNPEEVVHWISVSG